MQYLLKKYLLILCTTVAFIGEAKAGTLLPEDFNLMYRYASNGNVAVLSNAVSRGLYIDSVNSDGDTGLCVAARRRDVRAFKTFLAAGANSHHRCTQSIEGYDVFAERSKNIPDIRNRDEAKYLKPGAEEGMSTTTKVLIGTGVVAAGVGIALAASGGGGGSETKPDCNGHGMKESSGECHCLIGYIGSECSDCDSGYIYTNGACYKDLNCQSATHSTGAQSGNTCVCNAGYSGTLCDECASGYGRISGNGDICYAKTETLRAIDSDETYTDKKNVNYNPVLQYSSVGSDIEASLSLTNSDKYADMYGLIYYNANGTGGDTISLGADTDSIPSQVTTFLDGFLYAYTDTKKDGDVSYECVEYNSNFYKNTICRKQNSEESLALTENLSNIINITNHTDSDVYGMYSKSATSIYGSYMILDDAKGGANLTTQINIDNTISVNANDPLFKGNIMGIKGEKADIYLTGINTTPDEEEASYSNHFILNITDNGNGSVYGVYLSKANGAIYNNLDTITGKKGTTYKGYSTITVKNTEAKSKGNIYGLYASNGTVNNLYGLANLSNADADATRILVNTAGAGNAYGIWSKAINNSGIVNVTSGSGIAYGLYSVGGNVCNKASKGAERFIVSSESTEKNAYGIYMGKDSSGNGGTVDNGLWIKARSTNGNAIGIYGENSTINNTSGILSVSTSGSAFGIYNIGGSVTNAVNNHAINVVAGTCTSESYDAYGNIVCTGFTANNNNAVGIYSNGGTVINSGWINVYGQTGNSYGIYATNGATVVNNGEYNINVNGQYVKSDAEDENNKWSNGDGTVQSKDLNGEHIIYIDSTSRLINLSSIKSNTSLELNRTTLGEGGSFEAPKISGNIDIDSAITTKGFSQNYTLSNAIIADDTSDLTLNSLSSLYIASLDGNNVNMTMKSFNDVVDNKSVADFLQNNYALQNNESLYNTLKEQENVSSLNNTLNDITGKKLFSRFADEDLTMMRELTFDLNNKLYMNSQDHLETAGSISTFNFNGNTGSDSRYALISQDYGKYNLGLNYGFANVSSDDGHNDNRRYEKMFHVGMPISYATNGLKFITTPRVGYASGSYERQGLNNEDYDGNIQKTMFGLMNETRYPLDFGQWIIAPSAEFNMVDYHTQGHEKGGTNKLNLNSQQNYSIEAGFGLNASTELKFSEKSKLTFINGISVYYEFADPYKLQVGIDGMNGTFDVRDENRTENRAVIRSGLAYVNDNMSIIGNVMSYVDKEYRTNATVDFKYAF